MIVRSTISLRDTTIKSCSPENYIQADGPPGGPEIVDRRGFAGRWNNVTFRIWGRGVELLIDSTTLALNNQVRIFTNLLCDVGVRYPAAFAVTAPLT